MSEQNHHPTVDSTEAIRLAIQTIGEQLNSMSQSEAELAITRRAVYFQRMLGEKSLPSRALSATRIAGQIVSKKYDDKCKRYVIEFAPLSGDHAGVVENIKSDRTDSMIGASVVKLWEPVKPGDSVTIFKLNDPPRESSSKVGPKGFRVAPYITVWKTKNDSSEDSED